MDIGMRLVEELSSQLFRLTYEGNQLWVKPSEKISRDLRAKIKENKSEIIAALQLIAWRNKTEEERLTLIRAALTRWDSELAAILQPLSDDQRCVAAQDFEVIRGYKFDMIGCGGYLAARVGEITLEQAWEFWRGEFAVLNIAVKARSDG